MMISRHRASNTHQKGMKAVASGCLVVLMLTCAPACAFAATEAGSALAPTSDDVPFVIIAIVLIIALAVLLVAMRNRNKG